MNMSKNIMRPLPSKYKESTGAQTRTNYLFFYFFFLLHEIPWLCTGAKGRDGQEFEGIIKSQNKGETYSVLMGTS